jgi:hypothetical protein
MAENDGQGEPFDIEEHIKDLEKLMLLRPLVGISKDPQLASELSKLEEKVHTGSDILMNLART